MGFGKKFREALKRMRGRLIIYGLVILVGVFLIVAPISRAVKDANIAAENGKNWFEEFFFNLQYISKVGENLSAVFSQKYFYTFLKGTEYYLIFSVIFVFVGIFKALPKHEFDKIENGSSDWATGGEQYRVLSKKQGIILAEKNYLPVDKRGNVNVLVVRRFWCW